MIHAKQRIPTTQFGFIELDMEYESAQEAIDDHTVLFKMYQYGTGLPATEWTKCRKHMLTTGECDPEQIDRMNKAQRFFINECKKTLRDINKDNQ